MSKILFPNHPVLHVFGQHGPHDKVFIVGNYKGLMALRLLVEEAMDQSDLGKRMTGALSTGNEFTETMTSDGEGFDLMIVCSGRDFWEDAALPYTIDPSDVGFSELKGTRPWIEFYAKELEKLNAANTTNPK